MAKIEQMLIFNTTFHVEDKVRDAYLEYMKLLYIPKAVSSGFLQVLSFAHIHSQHGEQGTSYALQFRVKNSDTLDYWMKNEGESLRHEIGIKFGENVLAFVTILEEIEF